MSKQRFFPHKPETEEGFKEPVSWLGGRELITSLKGMFIYSLYGESLDPRRWMKTIAYPPIPGKDTNAPESDVNDLWAGKNAQCWKWKKDRFGLWRNYFEALPPDRSPENEFWFDYIADTGDGQLGVYGVGCLCLSDLWLKADNNVRFVPENTSKPVETLLPRGSFLFVGGDTAYHAADYSSLHERFQLPFRWAFKSVRELLKEKYGPTADLEGDFFLDSKTMLPVTSEDWDGTFSTKGDAPGASYWDSEPLRPIFGVPANHDYYDGLDGFNRQFRRPPFSDVLENQMDDRYANNIPLKIPTFAREQEASYTALRLPYGWWFLGIDSENEKLDFRQRAFFEQLMENERPKKLIVATPEPTTVFGRKCDLSTDKTAKYLEVITRSMGIGQPFLNDGKIELSQEFKSPPFGAGGYCRLDLSGDVHHYARYWGEKVGEGLQHSDNYASLVAGGGGAFFDSTETMIGKSVITVNGKTKSEPGEIPPQVVFPEPCVSRRAVADRIFDLSNIKKGGYVQIAGAAIAAIVFLCLTKFSNIYDFFFNKWDWSLMIGRSEWVPGLSLLAAVILFAVAAWLLHSLNMRLKDATDENPDNGRIKQLRMPFVLFLAGLALYVFMFLIPDWHSPYFLERLPAYIKSVLLLLHIAGALALLWIGIEYSNWLPLRFKFVRESGAVLESWLALVIGTSDKMIDEKLEKFPLIRRAWERYKKQSVENIPVYVVNYCALLLFVHGIYLFGNRSLSDIGSELVITLTVLGGLIGVTNLAVSTGAAYQKELSKKIGFGLIGVWHAILQLSTPFVLVYFADWRMIILVLGMVIAANGFAGLHTLAKFLGLKGKLPKFFKWRFGAWVMKKGNAAFLAATWVLFGLIVLLPPVFMKDLGWVQRLTHSPADLWPYLLSLLVAAMLGYRMSRVWFSWYLAVSLAFNGHNNEAGGAARIQGFKHILRINVKPTELTVYVIGFEKPATDIRDLEPHVKLIDKFTLKVKTIDEPDVAATASVR